MEKGKLGPGRICVLDICHGVSQLKMEIGRSGSGGNERNLGLRKKQGNEKYFSLTNSWVEEI